MRIAAAMAASVLVLGVGLSGCVVVVGSPETDVCGNYLHREVELTFINNTSENLHVFLQGAGEIEPCNGVTLCAHGGTGKIEAEIYDRELPAAYTWRAGPYGGLIVLNKGESIHRTIAIPCEAVTVGSVPPGDVCAPPPCGPCPARPGPAAAPAGGPTCPPTPGCPAPTCPPGGSNMPTPMPIQP